MKLDTNELVKFLNEGGSADELAKAFTDALNEAQAQVAKDRVRNISKDVFHNNLVDSITNYIKDYHDYPDLWNDMAPIEIASGFTEALDELVRLHQKEGADWFDHLNKAKHASMDLKKTVENLKKDGWDVKVLKDEETPTSKIKAWVATLDHKSDQK